MGALIGLGARAVPAGQQRRVPRIVHVVRPGDTLWEIAKRLAPGDDPRRLVQAIIDENRLGPAPIWPGQRLYLPPA